MREINESWRVLQDTASRRRYDDSRIQGRRHTSAAPRPMRPNIDSDDDDLVDVLPPMTAIKAGLMRHLPWVVMLVVLGAIFVFSAYATADRTSTPGGAASTCLNISSGTSTTMVPCSGPHDFQVMKRVREPDDCPPDTEARRLERESVFDCVVASDG